MENHAACFLFISRRSLGIHPLLHYGTYFHVHDQRGNADIRMIFAHIEFYISVRNTDFCLWLYRDPTITLKVKLCPIVTTEMGAFDRFI